MANKYVQADGSDSNTGNDWGSGNAYASIEKGMAETGSGDSLYIESGMYSETFSNLAIASGNTSITLEPTHESHVSTDPAIVIIGTGTPVFVGDRDIINTSGFGYDYWAMFSSDTQLSTTRIVQSVNTYIRGGSAASSVRIRPFTCTLSGSTATVTHMGKWSGNYSIPSYTNVYVYSVLGKSVSSGQYIGILINRIGGTTVSAPSGGDIGVTRYVSAGLTAEPASFTVSSYVDNNWGIEYGYFS
jgi:hypothetical protein